MPSANAEKLYKQVVSRFCNNDSKDGQQCCVLIVAFLGVFAFGAWIELSGLSRYAEESKTLAANTKELCLIGDYEPVECSYSCSENNDNIQCTGTTYQYTATIETKCRNDTLTGFDGDCPAELRTVGEEHTCYLLDCESEFDVSYSGGIHWHTWGQIAIGIFVILLMPCMFICIGLKNLYRKLTWYQKYGKWPNW